MRPLIIASAFCAHGHSHHRRLHSRHIRQAIPLLRNCKQSAKLNVVIKNVKASNGKLLVGINSNFGDTAMIDSATIDSATCATSVKETCEEFKGTTPGNEPTSVSKGPSAACKFTALKAC
ncbi:hypothetical protein EJ02DRAFT_426753 [Clathrospora elynae]|uniref:Pectate lyase n=1 Tax=Clathrospora elynae TaxID=706981 RepID=A0A6A5SBG0_9PLEO|nr:hypothetical protein EJ02DRAFT_426753 [Clathrospora elynae]